MESVIWDSDPSLQSLIFQNPIYSLTISECSHEVERDVT
jgi:hypothetical protein